MSDGNIYKMIKVAVCDDAKEIPRQLAGWIQETKYSCIVSVFRSGEELLKENKNYDIVLLDIGMHSMNGIETAKRLRDFFDGILIFITAFEDYVFDAFDVGAFHYLLKPLEKERFLEVFYKACEKCMNKEEAYYLVKIGGSCRRIPYSSILYLESNGRKIILHTLEEKIEFYGKMNEEEERMRTEFYRCHRGYLVSFSQITGYDSSNIFLKNGESIFLSKKKYADFVKNYMEYIKGK